jgi:hypothetical protein
MLRFVVMAIGFLIGADGLGGEEIGARVGGLGRRLGGVNCLECLHWI